MLGYGFGVVGGGRIKSYQDFLIACSCVFSRTVAIRKLLCGQRCPWRQRARAGTVFCQTHRPSEGGLPSLGLASCSALTWALAEASRRGRLRLLVFSKECHCPSQARCGAEPLCPHILSKCTQVRRQLASNSVEQASRVGV